EVEAIVDSRIFRKKLQYRVQWKGYNELTWEPHNHVDNCPELVQDFHVKYPSKPGPNLSLSEIAPKREGCHEPLGCLGRFISAISIPPPDWLWDEWWDETGNNEQRYEGEWPDVMEELFEEPDEALEYQQRVLDSIAYFNRNQAQSQDQDLEQDQLVPSIRDHDQEPLRAPDQDQLVPEQHQDQDLDQIEDAR